MGHALWQVPVGLFRQQISESNPVGATRFPLDTRRRGLRDRHVRLGSRAAHFAGHEACAPVIGEAAEGCDARQTVAYKAALSNGLPVGIGKKSAGLTKLERVPAVSPEPGLEITLMNATRPGAADRKSAVASGSRGWRLCHRASGEKPGTPSLWRGCCRRLRAGAAVPHMLRIGMIRRPLRRWLAGGNERSR